MTKHQTQRIARVRRWLNRFPAIRQRLPLVRSTKQRIFALAEDCQEATYIVRNALAIWIFSKPHLNAILEPGSWLYTLEGEPVEPVTDEDREGARRHLATPSARKSAKATPEQTPIQVVTATPPVNVPNRPILRLKQPKQKCC